MGWGNSIEADGDIILYGCEVAKDLAGAEFVKDLSEYTQADILASTDTTGSETLGGDWDLEYAIGKIEAESIFNTEIKNDYSSILVGNIPFTPLDAVNYLALKGFDVPRYSYTPIYTDITKGLPLKNIGNEAFSLKPNNTNLALLNNANPYKFDKPRLNSLAFDFSTDSLTFNHHNFEFSSITPNENSITFGFETGKFDFSSFTSNNSLKFEFYKPGTYTSAIEKVDFNSMLSFDAKAVTFTSTSVTFDYLPKSVNFNANLFKINSHLFDYKFLNGAKFSFTQADDADFYKNFNASDYRALEYAFSGDELFDSNYYLAQGAIPKGMNPFTDYFENGYAAGKDPNPLFDTSYYNQNNPDVVAQGVEPMVHFSTTGYKENNLNRDPHPLFDTSYYNEKNPDVVKYSINPLVHFSTTGYKENNLNRDPHPLFDTSYYNEKNPDVVKYSINPLVHFSTTGYKENNLNRDPHPLFDTSYYNEKNPDVVKYSINPLVHFLTTGYKENNLNRDPHPLFDTSYYNEKNPDVVKYSINPLVHFSTTGYKENNLNRDPHPLFDTSYYNEKNPDVVKYSINPLVHFSTTGYKENNLNRDPHPLFDTSYYNEKNPDVVKYSINPLVHFLTTGYKENNLNRDPNALFDTSYYNAKNLDVVRSGMNPLEHYIRYGFAENSLNRDPNALFDTSYYNAKNPDVVKAGMNPLEHYIFKGYSEDFDIRDPNALFDSSYYRANNPDVVKTGINPLEHYIRYGWRESLPNNPGGTNPNRDPNALFDTEFYFKIYEDVRLAALTDPSKNPLQHYLEFGQTDAIKRITHPIFQSENQLKFKTVITPESKGFAFAQNEFGKLNFELTPRENGGIQIAQRNSEGGVDIIGVGGAIVYTVFTGAVFLIKERSLPGIIYNAFQDGGTFENFSITKGDIDFNPPPFPGQKEARIIVESFPNGKQINDILNTDGGNIFVTPTKSALNIPNNTSFPQRDEILGNLLNGGLFIGGETTIQGTYVLANKVIVEGDADFEAEIPQAVRLGELEGGGTVRFLGGNSQGIEGYFIPSGEIREKPFSLKNASNVGRKTNLIQIINDNGIQIQRAGITDPTLLRIEVKQFGAEEIKNFVDNGPIKNIPLEGIFEKIYFDTADGTVVVDSTGTSIR